MTALRCLYSCASCGLSDALCCVPERDEGEADVLAWMQNVATAALAADHARRSPTCRASALSNVKIPVTGVSRIGDAPRH